MTYQEKRAVVHSLRINLYYVNGNYSESKQITFNKYESFKVIYDRFRKEYNRLTSFKCYSLELGVFNTAGKQQSRVIRLTADNNVIMGAYNKELLPINIFKYLSPSS